MKNIIHMIGFTFISALFCSPAFAVGLKQNSIVKDNTITLGDVFYDLPEDKMSRVLGNSPRPGQEMVLNARTLLRIALALDLSWRPSSNNEQIVLRRDATVINYTQIKDALHTALYDEGVNGEYALDIPDQHHQIILPSDLPPQVEITRFHVDATRKNFKATLAAPSAQNPVQHIVIQGRLSPIIEVPVLAENLQNGHIIKHSDIRLITIKEREFTKDTIVDVDALIGMTARRMVIADRPIKRSDLIAPQVVERGALVNLTLDNSIMRITTQAKALENGAHGEVIRVVNTDSNQTIQAKVTGPNEVVIVN